MIDFNNSLITARAGVSIFLVLDKYFKNGEVAVPANLCYAGIYPVIYSGNTPVFADVSAKDGNVTLQKFKEALTENTVAAIVPHMYGNPVAEMPEIAELCRKNGILLIEDCASAMGATAQYDLGNMGDYTVYSTGYSKTVDLGMGGLLYSKKHDVMSFSKAEKSLPEFAEADKRNEALFSRIYRLLRNEGNGMPLESAIYKEIPKACKNMFLHRISAEDSERIKVQLNVLPEIIKKRRECQQRYEKNLENANIEIYNYSSGAVPWRFNFFVDEANRKKIIYECLKNQLPISDWYPCVTNMFGVPTESFVGAKKHENTVLNFPIPISDTETDEICERFLCIVGKRR